MDSGKDNLSERSVHLPCSLWEPNTLCPPGSLELKERAATPSSSSVVNGREKSHVLKQEGSTVQNWVTCAYVKRQA